MEIKGKFGTAICYANVIDIGAVEQIRRMLDCKFMENSKVRIMPDVHVGTGCTVGTTMTIVDKIVPNLVDFFGQILKAFLIFLDENYFHFVFYFHSLYFFVH